VLLQIWSRPNEGYAFAGSVDDQDYKSTCYCNRCETHIEPELINGEAEKIQLRYIHVCPECGSDEVGIRQWIKPNDSDKPGGNDCPESEDCWCNSCQRHNSLGIKEIHPSKTNTGQS
jgi:hypothetical protein